MFKAGGKVVKNVTGYDLSKLMCGAWGRLAVLTEVTLKVLPAPHVARTLVWSGLDAASAWALMGEAMRLPAEVAAAAYLPAGAMALLRIEGFGPSVDARAALLVRALAAHGTPAIVDGAASHTAWRPLAEAAALADEPVLWRVSVPRSAGIKVADAVARDGGRWIADWAGGLLWCALDGPGEGLRALTARLGGHATLWRAPPDLRCRVPAFHPQPAGLAALAARVRKAFDPHGLFDTGRFLDRGDAN